MQPLKPKPSDNECAYAAGFFDGEGCVSLYNRNRTFQLRVSVAQIDIRPLLWLMERFGGTVHPHGHRKGQNNMCWYWSATAIMADHFLRCIRPWMIVKADQADIALAFRKTVRIHRKPQDRLDPETFAERILLRQRLQELNRRVAVKES